MNKAFEIWKDINGFEGIYQISDKGNIRSLDREIICSNGSVRFQRGTEIKPYINKQGYRTVVLHNIGKHKMCRICRLVAEAFIPNPQNLPQVNHKDENKANDEKENLEWCTCLYNLTYNNLHHRRNNKNNRKSKPVAQIKCGKIIKVFPSIREVERVLGFQNGNISQCCNGKTKTSYGYEWAYLKGSEVIERIN